ncbi:MAG: hypothetical protein KAJ23_00030 [Maribacter sp.]|nr:hypothetical protein [Maribacter sp.]
MRLNKTKNPDFRHLRAYAFDPSLSLKIDTAKINRTTYVIAWEDLDPGPCGEYLEVIDFDPSISRFYTPVDLNDRPILADNGLRPSVSNPQFHQQMVYAVAMVTIQNFEQALGRKIIWSPRLTNDKNYEEYVPKLRIYPHALRQANAFYSPYRKALLFGYFNSTPANNVIHMPNSLVFTCLSHDVISHEVTHAILDGIHRDYNNPTNRDMLAFHEAFADIVALFQHFTNPEVLKYEIANTRGNLGSQNLLGKLAHELGSAIGSYGSLRDAIGKVDKVTGEWQPKEPNSDDYQNVTEPHERGSILVAAIFEAFLTIYENRVADLLRIATSGTGVLEEGEIHPDLANRLAKEASKSARHVLNMCIRALDYCPPVDLTFGDYLRAVITADIDLMKEDSWDYRLAFIDSFRKRGIYPQNIKTLGIETLSYDAVDLSLIKPNQNVNQYEVQSKYLVKFDKDSTQLLEIIIDFLQDYARDIQYITDRKEIYKITREYVGGTRGESEDNIKGLHRRIKAKMMDSSVFCQMTGLAFMPHFDEHGFKKDKKGNFPSFHIQNLRVVSRVGPNGQKINHVVFSITQQSGCRINANGDIEHFDPRSEEADKNDDNFLFYGGCTLIFDLDSKKLKYSINKPLLDIEALKNGNTQINRERVLAQHQYQSNDMALHIGEERRYFGTQASDFMFTEPFAMLHQH